MSDDFILVSLPVPAGVANPVDWRVGFECLLEARLAAMGVEVDGGGTLFDPESAAAVAEIFVYGEPVEAVFRATVAFLAAEATVPAGARAELYTSSVSGGAAQGWEKLR